MNILFFAYWGANEGLSQATVMPHLKILSEMDKIDSITYVSIERTPTEDFQIPSHTKIRHVPFYSKFGHRMLSKIYDFVALPLMLMRLIRQKNISLLMCRSALAGGIGYWAHRLTGVPFTVESFEPHADYMEELGIWKKMGLSYRIQKHFEEKQKEHAYHLMSVSENFKNKLIEEGVPPDNVSIMPCEVAIDQFKFSNKDREQIRERLKIPTASIVGIYVGKFGDIYWDEEAFYVFKSAFDYFQDFQLILLNPQSKEFIMDRCQTAQIPIEKVTHCLINHADVASYLSAADFAFSTIRPSPSRKYCCPIKNGEYWANGLGIVSPSHIGDDSKIILEENGGVIINMTEKLDWSRLDPFISNHIAGNSTQVLAEKHRNPNTTQQLYAHLIEDFCNKN